MEYITIMYNIVWVRRTVRDIVQNLKFAFIDIILIVDTKKREEMLGLRNGLTFASKTKLYEVMMKLLILGWIKWVWFEWICINFEFVHGSGLLLNVNGFISFTLSVHCCFLMMISRMDSTVARNEGMRRNI